MRKWRNHQVTGDVGIQIENDEIMSAPMEHEIVFVLGWILLRGAENAVGGLRHIGSARGDVSMSPGTPESFHNNQIRDDSSCGVKTHLSRTLVDEFLEFLAGFEIRNPLGGNINGGAGPGISPSASS